MHRPETEAMVREFRVVFGDVRRVWPVVNRIRQDLKREIEIPVFTRALREMRTRGISGSYPYLRSVVESALRGKPLEVDEERERGWQREKAVENAQAINSRLAPILELLVNRARPQEERLKLLCELAMREFGRDAVIVTMRELVRRDSSTRPQAASSRTSSMSTSSSDRASKSFSRTRRSTQRSSHAGLA